MAFTSTSLVLILIVCLVSLGVGQDGLVQDYYHESCPQAEQIIATTVRELYALNISVALALLRLLFHDCFVMGCDASIMLDLDGQMESEKDSPPNLTVKGFQEIDIIKSKLEEACPRVVSCADTLAIAARESVILSGGPSYPVLTGRKDSMDAFPSDALTDIPAPGFSYGAALKSFASKGFDAKETVALLGAHSTGKIHCPFIASRLSNFNGTNGPDTSINPEFLEVLRAQCSKEDGALPMDYEGPGVGFGEVYYRSLLQGRGLLFVDQQLTSGHQTEPLVQTYAADVPRFRGDFGGAMSKLSNLQVPKESQVRLNCRKLN